MWWPLGFGSPWRLFPLKDEGQQVSTELHQAPGCTVILSLGTSLSCAISSSQATTQGTKVLEEGGSSSTIAFFKGSKKEMSCLQGRYKPEGQVLGSSYHKSVWVGEQSCWGAISRTRTIIGISVEGHTISAYGSPLFFREPRIWVTKQDPIGPSGNRHPPLPALVCRKTLASWSLCVLE